MIDPETVGRVRYLVMEDKMSLRKIARVLGIGRSTVRRITDGTRRPKPQREEREPDVENGLRLFRHSSSYRWCDECRASVKMPCLACQVRRIIRLRRDLRNLRGA